MIYKGFLDDNTKNGIESLARSYPYFLEMNGDFPTKDFVKWTNIHLPLQPLIIESGSSGENYLTERVLWGLMSKNGSHKNGMFLALQTADNRDRVAAAFSEWVVAKEPFATTLTSS